jgi:hypothetical protein
MPNTTHIPDTRANPANAIPTDDNPETLFHANGPINPLAVDEAVRTLMRAMPLCDRAEPTDWAYRRMFVAMRALAALHPRDEIELMLGVQALCAYQAAAALWRVGMNVRYPAGDSTRHLSAAGSAVRAFDALLKALERRQAKPLAVPPGRPAPREWPHQDPAAIITKFADRCRTGADNPATAAANEPAPVIAWQPETVALINATAERERIERENHGLDIANTDGIRPDGSIIMPEFPTPQQAAYVARRLFLRLKREWAENQRNGIAQRPKIRPLRFGDLVP